MPSQMEPLASEMEAQRPQRQFKAVGFSGNGERAYTRAGLVRNSSSLLTRRASSQARERRYAPRSKLHQRKRSLYNKLQSLGFSLADPTTGRSNCACASRRSQTASSTLLLVHYGTGTSFKSWLVKIAPD